MFVNKEYRTLVSMSEQIGVLKTPGNDAIQFVGDSETYGFSELRFKNYLPPLEMIVEELKAGRCIGQIYRTSTFRYEKGFAPNRDWKGSSWIGVDIDDTEVDMEVMNRELLRTPTFTMTTQSHMKGEHKNRYRLFYFFNKLLENYVDFCRVADVIVNDVRQVLLTYSDTEAPIDNITKQKSRFYFGNPCGSQVLASWYVYDPCEFVPNYSNETSAKVSDAKVKERARKEEKVLRPAVWPKLLECCLNPKYTFDGIVRLFHQFYHIRFMTEVEYPDDGSAFVLPPPNYMYLRFRWERKASVDGRHVKAVIRKWHNHEHRRRIFAAQLQLIAYMHNFELTIDQLVFHAIYLFHVAYCNSEIGGKKCWGKDYITPKYVLDVARVVYQMNKKDVEALVKAEIKKDKCNFLVNRDEAKRLGISVLKLLGKARHEFSEYRWAQWIEILLPYVQKGWKNNKLKKKLKEETGVVRSADTIGEHVDKYRTYRQENAENEDNGMITTAQNADNEGISVKNCGNFALFLNNYNNFSEIGQTASPAECSGVGQRAPIPNPSINKMGGILSQSRQIAVRNRARMRDKYWRRQLFKESYNPALADKENKKCITEILGISERLYYDIKKELAV